MRALPAQVILGPRTVGTSVEATVHLRSPAGAGWEVERIEADSSDVKVTPSAEGYRVVQAIKQEGDQSVIVRFFVRRGKAGTVVPVETTVSYFGQNAKERP